MCRTQLFRIFTEITTHMLTWILYIWIDDWDAFERDIPPEEIWKYKHPMRDDTISSKNLYVIILLAPSIMIFISSVISKNRKELVNGFLCLSIALALTGLITSLLKATMGKLRPDFFYRCFPNGIGDDFNCCTGNRAIINAGRKSFPSGHASLSFSSMTVLSLLFSYKLKLFKPEGNHKSMLLCICTVPFVVASMVSISRMCDNHHHLEDIAFGGMLGTFIGYICFRLFFLDGKRSSWVKTKTTQTGCVMHMR